MPKLPDNNPAKWNYDLHTRIKHAILTYYLKPWATIVGTGGRPIAYVDGFAGRGCYNGGQRGSPLLALDVLQDGLQNFAGGASRVTCHFVEADPDNFASLQAELAKHPAVRDSRIVCHVHHARFSAASPSIIADIGTTQQASFFFVDPFGYDDPPMRVLRDILRLPRAEVFINLMFEFVNRAISVTDDPKLAATLDQLVGSDAWRAIARLSGTPRERTFIELYRQQLKASGARYVIPFAMGDDDVARRLYYLIHATKHLRGALLMKDAMVHSATPGQLGYGGQDRHPMVPLFELDKEQLASLLIERFTGQPPVNFDDILAATIEETGACREADYRQCLQDLRKAGRITVTPVTSKTGRGLKGGDLVSFPVAVAQPLWEAI